MRIYLQMMGWLLATLLMASPCAAQRDPAIIELAQANSRPATTAVAAGEQGRSAQVNNWTVGIAGGFFEGTFSVTSRWRTSCRRERYISISIPISTT
jgi:hypothetical protein